MSLRRRTIWSRIQRPTNLRLERFLQFSLEFLVIENYPYLLSSELFRVVIIKTDPLQRCLHRLH